MQLLCRSWIVIKIFVICVAGSALVVNGAYSSEIPKAQIALFSNVDSIKPGSDLMLAVQFKIPDGWQTYWRTPGDVGYGAKFSWDGSKTLDTATVLWLSPKKLTSHGFNENIYAKSVIFPVKVTLKEPGKPLSIRLSIDYLLCQPESCVPLNQKLELELPAGNSGSSKNANLINQALLTIPHAGNTNDLAISKMQITKQTDKQIILKVDANAQDGLKNAELFVEASSGLKVNSPEFVKINDTNGYYLVSLQLDDSRKKSPSFNELLHEPLQLTLTNNNNAITVQETPVLKANDSEWLHVSYFSAVLMFSVVCLLIFGFVLTKARKNKTEK